MAMEMMIWFLVMLRKLLRQLRPSPTGPALEGAEAGWRRPKTHS